MMVNLELKIKDLKLVKGFTLIELLVVIGLIGILVAGVFSLMDPITQLKKARDSRRKEDLSTIQKALEIYYNDNGYYPLMSSSNNLIHTPVDGDISWGTTWAAYKTFIPSDPSSSRNYAYLRSSTDSQTYYLFASLERKNKDSQVCNYDNDTTTDDACHNVPSGATCGSVCNYGVSSPNTRP